MARTAIGIAIGILFVGAVIWSAFSESAAQCEICVDYKGRSACSIASAADVGQAEAQALAALEIVGYSGDPHEKADNLAFGHKRLVEIARALSSRPMLLLLDEPAAGLTTGEIEELDVLITKIRDMGVTVLLVEHHMDLVMEISDVVTVLDYGRKIAEGKPDVVRADPLVVEAYLGDDE